MKWTRLLAGLVIVGFLMNPSARAQADLVFAQMASGVEGDLEFETIATLTNLGSAAYGGTFRFWTGLGEVWNPIIGGQPVVNGEFAISIEPLATVTLVITGTELKAGFGILTGDGTIPGLLEGTLTYLVRVSGSITDSIGVTPSAGLLRTTIPFEEFATIGLALANDGPASKTVRLLLRDAAGILVETVDVELVGNAHTSRFLNQYFLADSVTRGRVDIGSDTMVHGTAVTLVGGQISTLPMRPGSVEYDLRSIADDGTISLGTISLQSNGSFVSGFLELTVEDGAPLVPTARTPLGGRLIDGDLRLTFFAGGPDFFGDGEDMVIDVVFADFSFDQVSLSARFTDLFLSESSVTMGTFELTRKQ